MPCRLADARFDAVRAAMQAGIQAGVFVPQLHGQCHYWPPALLAAAQDDAAVRRWLTGSEPAATEDLPSPLQSRWVDAVVLPSRELAADAIQQAASAEAAAYQAIFGSAPQVAVATTFVWNDAVEVRLAQGRGRGDHHPGASGHLPQCSGPAGRGGCEDADR